MQRAASKNNISGDDPNHETVPTVLNTDNNVLADITNNLGVEDSKEDNHENLIAVVKTLDLTRKTLFEESSKDKNM